MAWGDNKRRKLVIACGGVEEKKAICIGFADIGNG